MSLLILVVDDGLDVEAVPPAVPTRPARWARLSEGHCHPDDEEAAVAHMVATMRAVI